MLTRFLEVLPPCHERESIIEMELKMLIDVNYKIAWPRDGG
jgi:hypothetical protein